MYETLISESIPQINGRTALYTASGKIGSLYRKI